MDGKIESAIPEQDPIAGWTMTEGLEEILETSSGLMAKRGFHGTSMRDLAQETGRSLSGLYHYFRNKEDLVYLINVTGFRTLLERWEHVETKLTEPRARLYAFIFVHVSYFVEHMNEMRVMTWGTQVLGVERARTIQSLKDRYTAVASSIVLAVRETSGDRPMAEKQVSREMYLLFGMMNWMPRWYSTREFGTPGELVDDIYHSYLEGITRSSIEEEDVIRLRAELRELHSEFKSGRNSGASGER